MRSILITGNKGFIASGLKGDGFDIKIPGENNDIITYTAEQDYDVVIHTAAMTSVTESMEKPSDYIWTNVLGTLNMLQQHPESHFVYLSTASVYGEGENHTVQSELKPASVYASSKLAGEYLVKNFAKSWVILRLTNVVGPGERGEPNVYQIFEKSDVLTIYGDGLQTRDFIHVDKVRQAIMNSFDKQGIFNVGSGVSRTVLDVAKEFNKPLKFMPARLGEIRNFGVKDAFNPNSL